MDWNSSALWGIIGLVGGVIVSFIFHKIGLERKKLIYTIDSKALITNNLSDINGLNITYNSHQIKNLVSTTLNIKSTGKDIIEMNDFAKSSPLCIKTDGKFLFKDNINSSITKNTNSTNNITLSITDNDTTIQLVYDYFKRNDIITINLLHTGKITVDGVLKKGTVTHSNSIDKKNISDFINILGLTLGILFIIIVALLENGFGYFITQYMNLLFNMLLGIFFIDFYHKYKNNNIPK